MWENARRYSYNATLIIFILSLVRAQRCIVLGQVVTGFVQVVNTVWAADVFADIMIRGALMPTPDRVHASYAAPAMYLGCVADDVQMLAIGSANTVEEILHKAATLFADGMAWERLPLSWEPDKMVVLTSSPSASRGWAKQLVRGKSLVGNFARNARMLCVDFSRKGRSSGIFKARLVKVKAKAARYRTVLRGEAAKSHMAAIAAAAAGVTQAVIYGGVTRFADSTIEKNA